MSKEMNISKSSRHSKITGDFGETLILYWLSKYGFECALVDHSGGRGFNSLILHPLIFGRHLSDGDHFFPYPDHIFPDSGNFWSDWAGFGSFGGEDHRRGMH